MSITGAPSPLFEPSATEEINDNGPRLGLKLSRRRCGLRLGWKRGLHGVAAGFIGYLGGLGVHVRGQDGARKGEIEARTRVRFRRGVGSGMTRGPRMSAAAGRCGLRRA
jgi:hypothetical protein